MSDASRHDALIRELSAGQPGVRRLPPPALRALGWVAVVVALGFGLAQIGDLAAMRARLLAAPDLWLAASGSASTAMLSVLAAFETSVPGRSRWWSLLPAPGVLLWLGASGAGCVRAWTMPGAWAVPGAHDPTLVDERMCLVFIVCVSLPLSLLLGVMLRRAHPLRPGLTAGLGGLAAAGAAATLLNLFHPYDAALSDLLVHLCAVALVVAANRLLGGRPLPPSI